MGWDTCTLSLSSPPSFFTPLPGGLFIMKFQKRCAILDVGCEAVTRVLNVRAGMCSDAKREVNKMSTILSALLIVSSLPAYCMTLLLSLSLHPLSLHCLLLCCACIVLMLVKATALALQEYYLHGLLLPNISHFLGHISSIPVMQIILFLQARVVRIQITDAWCKEMQVCNLSQLQTDSFLLSCIMQPCVSEAAPLTTTTSAPAS